MAPGSVYETSVQALVAANADALFPEFECRRLDPYFQTAAGDVQPDLVLIGRSVPIWGLVEVEAEEHSATRHVKPQLAKLCYARATGAAREKIAAAFANDIDEPRFSECVSGTPIVYLVTHGTSPVPIEDLRTLSVRSIEISIYHGGPNDYILRVEDGSDRLIHIPLGAERMRSPMLRGIWHLRTEPIAVVDESCPEMPVDFDGTRSIWSCKPASDGYILRMPTGLIDDVTARSAEAVFDVDDVTLVMHARES